MKTITNLTGVAAEGTWNFNTGKVSVELDVANAVKGNAMRGIQLSKEGIAFYKGRTYVAIPASELWKLAESIEPGFKNVEVDHPPQPQP